jgi:hypothetical protein
MKQKSLLKLFFISTMLVAATLGLLGLPFDQTQAGPPDPAVDIKTTLQSYQMPGIRPSLSDGRLLEAASSPPEASMGAPDPTPNPATDIRTKLQPYQISGVVPFQSDGRQFEQAPGPSKAEEPPIRSQAQQTFYSIADAVVLQGYASLNLGGTTDMWAGYDDYLEPDGQIARSLLGFDISSLPPDVVITSATLRAYLVNSWDYPDRSRIITAYQAISSWSEGGVTWNNKPGYGAAYGSSSIPEGAWGWYQFDVTNLVKAWYNGAYTNYGIMLRGPEISGSDSSWRGFGTREGSYDPQLVVEYSPLPAPQDHIIYLPLTMKDYSPPTPTPTPLPSSCPQTGAWSGTTDDGDPISFTVSTTPSCRLAPLTITMFLWCSGFPGYQYMTVSWNTLPISNNHFSTGSGMEEVVGDFTSPTTATGTWLYWDTRCQGSGTWTATH